MSWRYRKRANEAVSEGVSFKLRPGLMFVILTLDQSASVERVRMGCVGGESDLGGI